MLNWTYLLGYYWSRVCRVTLLPSSAIQGRLTGSEELALCRLASMRGKMWLKPCFSFSSLPKPARPTHQDPLQGHLTFPSISLKTGSFRFNKLQSSGNASWSLARIGKLFFHEKGDVCCLILDRLRALNATRWNLPCGSYFWPKFWGIQGKKSVIPYCWWCQLSSSAALHCPRLQSSGCRGYTEQRKDEGLFEQISWGKNHKQMYSWIFFSLTVFLVCAFVDCGDKKIYGRK